MTSCGHCMAAFPYFCGINKLTLECCPFVVANCWHQLGCFQNLSWKQHAGNWRLGYSGLWVSGVSFGIDTSTAVHLFCGQLVNQLIPDFSGQNCDSLRNILSEKIGKWPCFVIFGLFRSDSGSFRPRIGASRLFHKLLSFPKFLQTKKHAL